MKTQSVFVLAVVAALFGSAATADPLTDAIQVDKGKPGGNPGGGGGGTTDPVSSYPVYSWMNPGIVSGWNETFDANGDSLGGNFGQGVSITIVDDFSSGNTISANLGDGRQSLQHGEWTYKEAKMLAPLATMVMHDFSSDGGVGTNAGLDVINLSFRETVPLSSSDLPNMYASLLDIAASNSAVITKSAGNGYGAEVGYVNDIFGNQIGEDFLSQGLVSSITNGANSTIFVGALNTNGDPNNKATMASYSNVAGMDTFVQDHFLVVGVEGAKGKGSAGTGLTGTSFAAPIVAGYAAVLGSKFESDSGVAPSATAVADRLLSTARTDTIAGYDVAIHGQGEADISASVSPDSIN